MEEAITALLGFLTAVIVAVGGKKGLDSLRHRNNPTARSNNQIVPSLNRIESLLAEIRDIVRDSQGRVEDIWQKVQ